MKLGATMWRWVLPALLLLVVVGYILLSDPSAHQLADLRIHLLRALSPVADNYGLSSFALTAFLYPLVAINILLPVLIIGLLRHRRILRNQLAGIQSLAAPWPRIAQRSPRGDCEEIQLEVHRSCSGLCLACALLLLGASFAVALYGRDQLRIELADDGAMIRVTLLLEVLVVVVSARLAWAWTRAKVLQRFAHMPLPSYWDDGWLLRHGMGQQQRSARRLLLANDAGLTANWSKRLAQGIGSLL